MENTVSERLRLVVESSGLSVRAFAERIGAKQNTLNQQILGQRRVSVETMAGVLSAFEGISSKWLITGRGEMLKTERKPDADNAALAGILAAIRGRYNLTDAEIAKKVDTNLQYMLDTASGKLPASERLRKILMETFPDLNQREAETTSPDTAALLELLKNQSIQITKCQEQIDRLISIIEKFNTK